VKATDALGNTDATPASYTWTVDTAAPDTTITASPTNPTNVTSASFQFTSTKSGSTFQCSLDGAAFTVCTSPQPYSGLAATGHTFQVKATDAIGNTDATPASYTWTVDTAAPDTTNHRQPEQPDERDDRELRVHVDGNRLDVPVLARRRRVHGLHEARSPTALSPRRAIPSR